LLASCHVRGERAPEHGIALQPEHPAECLIDEGEPPLAVAAQDDVGLAIQEIAIAGLVLADLPLDILQLLQAALEALADADEAVELGHQLARTRRRAGAQRQLPAA